MDKLRLIIRREFLAKVKNKSFIIMTFVSPVVALTMGVLIMFLTKKNNNNTKEIVYIDDSGLFTTKDFKSSKSVKYTDFSALGVLETKKKVEAGNHYGFLYIPKVNGLELLSESIQFFSKDTPSLVLMEDIEKGLNNKLRSLKMQELGIDEQKIKLSRIRTDIKLLNFSGEKSSKLTSGLKIGFGGAAGYLIMMLVVIYGNAVMRSVIEEKTSRIIEVIISSVKPFQFMLGKIIGNASAGLFVVFRD